MDRCGIRHLVNLVVVTMGSSLVPPSSVGHYLVIILTLLRVNVVLFVLFLTVTINTVTRMLMDNNGVHSLARTAHVQMEQLVVLFMIVCFHNVQIGTFRQDNVVQCVHKTTD